jgi:hypothetical protein
MRRIDRMRTPIWASPYIRPLERHLKDVLAGQPGRRGRHRSADQLPRRKDDPVRQMRMFNRLLNYGTT